LRLRDRQSIEWIVMVRRQAGHRYRMLQRDRKIDDSGLDQVSPSRSNGKSSRPSACLIAITQALTTLANTKSAGSSIASLTKRGSFPGADNVSAGSR
jgi:hypothetical protein